MLEIVQGNLLKSDCHVIIHQANCMGTFGSGIARQIKEMYPKAYQADLNFPVPIKSKERLGQYSVALVENKFIVNLYSQYAYGRNKVHTDYSAMEKALDTLLGRITNYNSELKIGLPYLIGAGLAGGDATTILGILERVSKKHNKKLYLYQLK